MNNGHPTGNEKVLSNLSIENISKEKIGVLKSRKKSLKTGSFEKISQSENGGEFEVVSRDLSQKRKRAKMGHEKNKKKAKVFFEKIQKFLRFEPYGTKIKEIEIKKEQGGRLSKSQKSNISIFPGIILENPWSVENFRIPYSEHFFREKGFQIDNKTCIPEPSFFFVSKWRGFQNAETELVF